MTKVTFKNQPIQISGHLPKVGSRAPDFHLVNQDLKDCSLHDFKGKKKLISIVPSLDTPVCMASAKKFNDAAKKHADCVILFVSADLPFAQKRLCGIEHLENIKTLSMMRDKEFGKCYGILIEEGPLKGLLARSLLVLDQNDHVIYEELVSEITHEPNYDAALKHL